MPDLAPVPPRYFRSSIPRAEGIDDYEPRDARSRADAYTQWSGIADGWPIPLTRVGEPPLPLKA